jgi:hypothetical protein
VIADEPGRAGQNNAHDGGHCPSRALRVHDRIGKLT